MDGVGGDTLTVTTRSTALFGGLTKTEVIETEAGLVAGFPQLGRRVCRRSVASHSRDKCRGLSGNHGIGLQGKGVQGVFLTEGQSRGDIRGKLGEKKPAENLHVGAR